MLRLSKKVEYGLLATQYIASQKSLVVSAKEIAEKFGISFELTSKVLQQLMKSGIIQSQQGVRGGYVLARIPNFITVADIIQALEGKSSLTECSDENQECGCTVGQKCTIKNPLLLVQERIDVAFRSMSLAEML